MDCEALWSGYASCLFILICSSVVILAVLSFSTHRKNLCLECCSGRPGLYSPVDLLHRGPHRLIYAVIFGAMSDQFLNLALLGGGSIFSTTITNPYVLAICDVAISNVLSVLLLCLLYGPLFACVNTPRPLLGHITGLLYLLLIATFETYSGVVYTQCDGVTYDGGQTTLIILTSLPSYMFYVILIAWFIYEIVNDVAIAKRGRGILFTHKKNAYLYKYTGHLLRKKVVPADGQSRWQKFKAFFWVYEKDFRFPLRLVAPLVVMIVLNFKLFFLVVYLTDTTSATLIKLFTSNNAIAKQLQGAILAGAVLAGLMAMAVCGVLLLQFAATVHKHLKLAAQGKFKFYSKSLPSHTNILVSALKYGGYQIGYFAWAWLIFWGVSLALLGAIAAPFVGLKLYPQAVGPRLFKYVLTVLWIPVVLFAHKLMCKFVFLENDTGGKFLAITNRNGFNCFAYFVFLYNGIVGFVAAIFRVLLGLLFGTLLLFRLDQNIMMDHFKFADLGHKTYLGFLYLEHTYNNPVANTFVALLTDGGGQEDKHSLKGPLGRNRRIRNRWLVAYTLINNPSLIPLRASQMEAQRERGGQEADPEKRELNDYEPIVLVH